MISPFDDTSVFLSDFGVDCVCNGKSFRALLDSPDEILDVGAAQVLSRQYLLTFATADISLNVGDKVFTKNATYKVRNPPKQRYDGVFSDCEVSKV